MVQRIRRPVRVTVMEVSGATGGRGHRRRDWLAAASVLILLGVLVVVVPRLDGGALVSAPTPSPPTARSSSPAADLSMTVDPATAAPDAVVTLGFPGEPLRGVAFTLESEQGAGWQVEYHLVAPWRGEAPGPGSWSRVGGLDFGWPDIAISGPGGERVRIPDTAVPGRYRLCTSGSSTRACAPLTIT